MKTLLCNRVVVVSLAAVAVGALLASCAPVEETTGLPEGSEGQGAREVSSANLSAPVAEAQSPTVATADPPKLVNPPKDGRINPPLRPNSCFTSYCACWGECSNAGTNTCYSKYCLEHYHSGACAIWINFMECTDTIGGGCDCRYI
jgi:hypothetical protein